MKAVDFLREHYRSRFHEHGDDPLSAQMSVEGQRFRFQKLFELADLDGSTVLDVGCGLGDMYPSLHQRFPGARYHGVDIVPEMISCAAAKYPEVEFTVANLLDQTLPKKYEYVLLSVVFNNAIPEPTDFLAALVERAWAHCTRGLAFNFLSIHHNFTEPSMAYHDPARVLDFCVRRLSRKVRMEHHYQRSDVAVFLYR